MKKVLSCLTICALMVALSAAFAGAVDSAKLYKRCQGCHGADGSTLAMGVGAPLKGQSSDELYTKMMGYMDGSYGENKKAIMTNILKRLSDEEIKALSDYIAAF